MWLTPLSTASRSNSSAAVRLAGGPNTLGPVSRIAPKPIGDTENGPSRRASMSLRDVVIGAAVGERAVEVDLEVRAVAERFVARVAAAAEGHLVRVRDLATVGVGEVHGTRDEVRAIF